MSAFHLVTTASAESVHSGALLRLIDSLEGSSGVHVVCVARDWPSATVDSVRARCATNGLRVSILEAGAETSLSEARNLALAYLVSLRVDPDSIVAFPDDDCWYFSDTLSGVATAMHRRPDAQVVAGCYGPTQRSIDRTRYPEVAQDLSIGQAARIVSSVTIFIRARQALHAGGFNPTLGAGTPILGGEDVDFVLRLLESGSRVVYQPDIVVGHAYERKDPKSYSGSFVLVIAGHLHRSPRLFPVFFRALLGSMRVRHRTPGDSMFQAFKLLRPSLIRLVAASSSSAQAGG